MFQYTNPHVPPGYRCGTCGAEGCKLWRPYGSDTGLTCCVCACNKYEVSEIDDRGTQPVVIGGKSYGRSDQIGGGSLVPAVPNEDGTNYYCYGAVPDLGVAWWRALPTKPKDPNS